MNSKIRNNTIVFLIIYVLWLAGVAFAGDIYKWIDEQGNVHFGDRPTDDEVEGPPPVDQNSTDSSAKKIRDDEQGAVDEPPGPKPDAVLAESPGPEEKCTNSRTRLRILLTSRDSYRTDENGKQAYLDDPAILAARETAQSEVEKYCNN